MAKKCVLCMCMCVRSHNDRQHHHFLSEQRFSENTLFFFPFYKKRVIYVEQCGCVFCAHFMHPANLTDNEKMKVGLLHTPPFLFPVGLKVYTIKPSLQSQQSMWLNLPFRMLSFVCDVQQERIPFFFLFIIS